MKAKKSALAIVAFASAAWGATAFAEIIFTEGNNPQPDETNIFFSAPDTGTCITGHVGSKTGPDVDFCSLTGETLEQNAQGQALITNAADTPQNPADLTSISIEVPGYTFGDFILNPLNGSGTATVTVTDNFAHVFTYDLGNGQNYLTITTGPDANGIPETIAKIEITMSAGGGFEQFKQPRISQVCNTETGECLVPPQQIPEPGVLGLLALGLLAVGTTLRRPKA